MKPSRACLRLPLRRPRSVVFYVMVGPERFVPQLAFLPATAALGAALLHLAVGAAGVAFTPEGAEEATGGGGGSAGETSEGGRGGGAGAGGDWSGTAATVALTHLGGYICGSAAARGAAAWGDAGALGGRAAALAALAALVRPELPILLPSAAVFSLLAAHASVRPNAWSGQGCCSSCPRSDAKRSLSQGIAAAVSGLSVAARGSRSAAAAGRLAALTFLVQGAASLALALANTGMARLRLGGSSKMLPLCCRRFGALRSRFPRKAQPWCPRRARECPETHRRWSWVP